MHLVGKQESIGPGRAAAPLVFRPPSAAKLGENPHQKSGKWRLVEIIEIIKDCSLLPRLRTDDAIALLYEVCGVNKPQR